MPGRLARRQTLASFDYQWGHLPSGDAMLSDPWFVQNADRIVAEELLGVDRAWFRGRRALDAGCGGGRWTLGLLRLGCEVVAVDSSAGGLESTREQIARLAPETMERLVTDRVDLLEIPQRLANERFDLVFSFGVLHHTGDAHGALRQLATLVRDDGLLFLYLYGSRSASRPKRALLTLARLGLAPIPFSVKAWLLERLLPGRDPHQAFDLISPLVNQVHSHEVVEAWLRELDFDEVSRTLDHTELFLRASRRGCSAHPFRPPASGPYWFERYRPGRAGRRLA